MAEAGKGYSTAAVRGTCVNLFSVVCAFFFFGVMDATEGGDEFHWSVAALVIVLIVIEPVAVYLKMDAILGRVSPKKSRLRSFIFNPFMIPILWGGRFALYMSILVGAMETFTSEGELPAWLVVPMMIFGLVREGVIVWCFARTKRRFVVSPSREWVVDFVNVLILAIAETFAIQIIHFVGGIKMGIPEVIAWIAFQALLFAVFFLPLRLAYTLEEVYSIKTRRETALLVASLAICFLAIVILIPRLG